MKNEKVIITGASSGIGEATAYLLAEKGAHVILLARNEEKLKAIQNKILDKNQLCDFYPIDLKNATEIEKVFKQIFKEIGTPTILINNAGVGTFQPIDEMSPEQIIEPIKVPFQAAILCSYYCVKEMKKANNGRILFITSPVSYFPLPYMISYTASRYGIKAASFALRDELKKDNIKVNLVVFGKVNSEYLKNNNADFTWYPKASKWFPEISTQKAAEKIYKTLQKDKKENIFPSKLNFFLSCYKLVPNFSIWFFKMIGLYEPMYDFKK
ncbi:SDR family NAD(P)-dependent oxidoreductase [Aureivirga sp. CE67]|uniref:SDR family NAD(P)-dependent oxidoreductase n=1 Tax=Aureivirga sp. CE67 TaxID=1788983 RepID=UPI0018CBB3B4|nr:SDR family NAD(P)-dependent oxidoreductase [Aureivirga sp. CE67]